MLIGGVAEGNREQDPGTDGAVRAAQGPEGTPAPWDRLVSPRSDGFYRCRRGRRRGVLVRIVDPVAAFAAQPLRADFADASRPFGVDTHAGRQSHRSFPDAAANAYVIVVLGVPTEIHVQLADSHVDFHAAQRKAPQVEPRLPRAEMQAQVHGNAVVQRQIPLVPGVAYLGVALPRLADGEVAVRARAAVAHFGLPRRHVVSEAGI